MATPESTIFLNDVLYTLVDLEAYCWQQLVAAPKRASNGGMSTPNGFKTGVVATRNETGADARTVVLRQADASQHTVWFHSDRRAAKLDQLRAYPSLTLVFWDEARQIQLRLTATATLHIADSLANAQWASLWVGSRKMYLSENVPGSEQLTPYPGFPARFGQMLPTEAETEIGRANFAAVQCHVSAMEFLHLHRNGQTRARFAYRPERGFVWLAP